MITQKYRLDMVPGRSMVRVPVSRYDEGSRNIVFELVNGSEPFVVPAGAVVTCDGTKPDRKGFTVPATFDGNTVTVVVTGQMAAVAGDAKCQITIKDNGAVLGSCNFTLTVEREALGNGTSMSASDISAIVQLNKEAAESAQAAASSAGDAAKSSEDAAATLREVEQTLEDAEENVRGAIADAGAAKDALDSSVADAGTAKDALDGSIADAGTAKDSLDNSIADGNALAENIDAYVQEVAESREAAEASAADAQASATAAEQAQSAAETARTAAETARDDAGASATTASEAASQAATSAANAATSEANASGSATAASGSAEAAQASAQAAEQSAQDAQSVVDTHNASEDAHADLFAKYYDATAMDLIFMSMLTPDNYHSVMRQWFMANGAAVMLDFSELCNRWYTITRRGWTGGTKFASPDVSSLSTGEKTGDNAGMTCVPSTNTVAGQDDYATNPLFIPLDCNVYLDDDGDPHITAIDGIAGPFERSNPEKIVGVLQMTPWCRYTEYEDGSYEYSITDVLQADGYYPWPDAVSLSGRARPWVVHGKYVFGDGWTCCSGQKVRVWDVSHNSQLTGVHNTWGARYCGKTTADDAWVKWMAFIKYGSMTLDGIMNGCLSYYNNSIHPAVAETGVERVIVSTSAGSGLLVGSTVCLGTAAYGSKSTQCSVVDRARIVSIEPVEIDGATYSAVNIDNGGVTFDTATDLYLTTMQWYTGSTDNVLGNDGSPYSNTSTKEPYKIQGIEQIVGCYEVLGDVILNYAQDADGVWRQWAAVCRDATKLATSITANYRVASFGFRCPSSGDWEYIKKLGHAPALPELMCPELPGGSSSTFTRDQRYTEAAGTTGLREWRAFCYLGSDLAGGGLSALAGNDGLGSAYWYSGGRLSTTGNRGEWAA